MAPRNSRNCVERMISQNGDGLRSNAASTSDDYYLHCDLLSTVDLFVLTSSET